MLAHVSINGFRCFRELSVDLKPLTVLIGPNDTGKSVFLDALEFLGPSDPKVLGRADRFRGVEDCEMEIVGTSTDGRITRLSDRLPSAKKNASGIAAARAKAGLNAVRFQLPGVGVSTSCQGFEQKEAPQLPLGLTGDRVAALIDYLLRNDLPRFVQLRDELKRLVPGFEDLKIETPTAQTRRIDFVIEGGFRIPAGKTSAGVRLLLFFLALVHHPNPPAVILLEEPETGIHPKRLADVMKILRSITQGEFGKAPAQVILTTHSPYLLDCVKPDEDQVLVFQRADDGSRTAKPVDWGRLKEYFDGFMLGEIWFNEEEARLVAQEAS